MKHILLIATGGTIASKYTKDGLSPAITAQELLTYIPAAGAFCQIDTIQPFFLDSTNVGPDQWLILADLIEKTILAMRSCETSVAEAMNALEESES